jgi:putative transposase
MTVTQTPPRKTYPTDLSEADFALITHLLPPVKPRGRPREVNLREVLNAIFYVGKTGVQWQYLPHDLPPYQTVWEYFNAWSQNGVLEAINEELVRRGRAQLGREPTPSAAILDSQSVRNAAEVPAGGYDANKKTKGVKRFLISDVEGHAMKVVVLPANTGERAGAQVLCTKLAQKKR